MLASGVGPRPPMTVSPWNVWGCDAQNQTDNLGMVNAQTETNDLGMIDAQTETENLGTIAAQTQTESLGMISAQTETENVGMIDAQTETENIGMIDRQTETETSFMIDAQTETENCGKNKFRTVQTQTPSKGLLVCSLLRIVCLSEVAPAVQTCCCLAGVWLCCAGA